VRGANTGSDKIKLP
jgi:hypothetical protein